MLLRIILLPVKSGLLLGLVLSFLLCIPAFGQAPNKVEEAERWLKQAKKDSVYVDKLNFLSNNYALSGGKDPLPLAKSALRLADSLQYIRGVGVANMNLAIIYDTRGQYHNALEHYLISMKQLRKVRDEENLAGLLQNLGFFYSTQANYRKAIEVTKQAADLTLKHRGEKGTTYCWNNLGYYYTEAGQYDSALYFTLKSYEILKAEKDTAGLAEVFYNLGNISWKADKNANKALNYSMQALEFYGATPLEAEPYIECKSFVGFLYLQLGNPAMAEHYLQEALDEAQKHRFRFVMKNIYRWRAQLYASMAAWDKAYESHSRFFQLHDSIFNEHSTNRVEQLKAEYELETREAKIDLLNKSRAMQSDELERQMLFRNSFMALFALFLIVAAVLFRSNTAKNKANQVLLEQKRQIEEKNAAIVRQNELLEEQQKAILAQTQNLSQANSQINKQQQAIEQKTQDLSTSLDYASRIQHAMMPQPEELKASLPDSFIWLQPKEVVSGDFYWFAQVNQKMYVAAIDCTGHGVPGAFMSLIGDLYLNQIIIHEEVQEADKILNRLHEHVRRSLRQEVNYNQDGMKVGLCVLDMQTREVQFAGARNNLYLCHGGEVQKISGDRMYVGGLTKPEFESFTVHQFSFAEPAAFYLSTDGVRDQFGGEQDKKFGEKRLMELITSIHELPMEEQAVRLRQEVQSWMKGFEQTDDMMAIGWKF